MTTALRTERILDALARWTATDLGHAAALDLHPAHDREAADARLDEVTEAEWLVRSSAALPLPRQLDVTVWLQQARRGAVLEGAELAVLARLARGASQLQRASHTWPEQAPRLRAHVAAMADLDLLAGLLSDAIDDEGHILDQASAELARLRHEVVTLAARLRRRIEALVKESDAAGLLQDEYYTLRDDRYVLPMRAAEKRTLAGIIHGTSQTGHTVYVEPQELVEGNNQLALAYDAVRREERRILAELSGLCGDHADELAGTAQRITLVDLRLAAAKLAIALAAHRPHWRDDGGLLAPRLRHPVLVLDGVHVVASDITWQPPQRWLVISGPNGGGKTVVLTALGLLVEMARLGLFVCAAQDVTLPWFERVEVVLGDAQDLERGLSTFEGHLRRVSQTLAQAAQHGRTLVLFDELASGTEPAAGGALATALLEHAATTLPLACGAVTTHFEGCKLLAVRDPAFVNAALTLDPRTLSPTYTLSLGQVGSSDPLALATRMGLPTAVIDRAQQLLGSGGSEVATLLERLSETRARLEAERQTVAHERTQLQHSRTLLEDQRRHEQRAADRRIERAAAEALKGVEEVAKELAAARQAAASSDRQRIEHAAQVVSMRQVQLEQAQRAAEARLSGAPQRPAVDQETLQVGTSVWHAGLQRAVEVIEASARRDRFKVKAGALELWCQATELRQQQRSDPQPPQQRKPDRRDTTQQPRQASDATQQPQHLDEAGRWLRTHEATADVRGMRVDEAIDAVDRHLDRAVLAGHPAACIVHGLGTGALRDAVRQHLRRHPQVDNWRAGQAQEGGDGATLVWLRQ